MLASAHYKAFYKMPIKGHLVRPHVQDLERIVPVTDGEGHEIDQCSDALRKAGCYFPVDTDCCTWMVVYAKPGGIFLFCYHHTFRRNAHDIQCTCADISALPDIMAKGGKQSVNGIILSTQNNFRTHCSAGDENKCLGVFLQDPRTSRLIFSNSPC